MQSILCQLAVQIFTLGFMELCAKILQIMRNDFKDYAHTFCQFFLPLFAKNLFRFCITHSRIQDQPILCLWDRQNSLPPSSKTSDFLYCLARSAALTLAESWLKAKFLMYNKTSFINDTDYAGLVGLCGICPIMRKVTNYARNYARA